MSRISMLEREMLLVPERDSRLENGEKMNTKRIGYLVVVLVMGFALAACERTKIGDIMADPGRFMNKDLNVAGEVTQSFGGSFGNFSQGLYQIDDGTGKLWVYSSGHGVPTKGARIGVKGQIKQSLTFNGRNYGTVLQESGRKSAD
jgi:hypothetical protein